MRAIVQAAITIHIYTETKMKQADQIREFVNRNWIIPAKARGLTTLTLTAGEIHKAMDLHNAMPAVVGAIDTRAFIQLTAVLVVQRTGPHQSSTVTWTFQL